MQRQWSPTDCDVMYEHPIILTGGGGGDPNSSWGGGQDQHIPHDCSKPKKNPLGGSTTEKNNCNSVVDLMLLSTFKMFIGNAMTEESRKNVERHSEMSFMKQIKDARCS